MTVAFTVTATLLTVAFTVTATLLTVATVRFQSVATLFKGGGVYLKFKNLTIANYSQVKSDCRKLQPDF